MFDNLNISKAYTLEDLYGNPVEVCTFNAYLVKNSNININMVINRPELYNNHRDKILTEYREFNANDSSLEVTMGLADTLTNTESALVDLEVIREEVQRVAQDVFTQVIKSVGEVVVNPVETYNSRY